MTEDRKITTVAGIEMFINQRAASGLDTDIRLARCPFCGHEAAFRVAEHRSRFEPGHPNNLLSVECTNTSCGVRTPEHYVSREAGIEAWNRRDPNAAPIKKLPVEDPEQQK